MVIGQAVDKIGAAQYAGEVAYASQQPYLTAASVRDNVTFGLAQRPSEAEILQAIEDAQYAPK